MGTNKMTALLMVCGFQAMADCLRNPEKYPPEVREQMAKMMDDLVSAGKRSALDELMNEELNKAQP